MKYSPWVYLAPFWTICMDAMILTWPNMPIEVKGIEFLLTTSLGVYITVDSIKRSRKLFKQKTDK